MPREVKQSSAADLTAFRGSACGPPSECVRHAASVRHGGRIAASEYCMRRLRAVSQRERVAILGEQGGACAASCTAAGAALAVPGPVTLGAAPPAPCSG